MLPIGTLRNHASRTMIKILSNSSNLQFVKYLREIITTVTTVVIIASGLLVRSLNLQVNNLDLLIGAFYGGLPFLIWGGWSNRIKRIIGKPKLEFKTSMEEEDFKQKKSDKEESRRITFWIHVRNMGNGVAENCRIRLKITDQSGEKQVVEKTTHPNVDEDISIPWLMVDQKQESRNIPISSYFDSRFKFPFVIESYPENNSKSLINQPAASMYFEDPIKKPYSFSMITLLGEKEITMGFLIEAIFLSDTDIIARKKFRLKLNLDSPIAFDPIEEE